MEHELNKNKLLAKRASGTPLLLTFSGERNSMQNAVVVETWTTHSQTRTCVVHTKREIRLPVVDVLGFRRRCLSSLISVVMRGRVWNLGSNLKLKGFL